jgi:carbon-monoxide dehydrogenase small subunit
VNPERPVELPVEAVVNGEHRHARVEPRRTLAEMLREDLGLTGTHLGCEHGVCGACTVLLDGEPVRSCLVLAVQTRERAVTTIEGLSTDPGRGIDGMHAVQRGFLESISFQCGFCTPGFLMTTLAFLNERAEAGISEPPSEAEVREAISANLCRCTGYQSIVDGVRRAAELMHETTGAV